MYHLSALKSVTPLSSVLPFALVFISFQGGRRVEGVHRWSSGPEDNSCRDVFRRCHIYKENNECQNSGRAEWMKRKCARSCGFCVPRTPACKESQFGCCEDRLTPADGPNRKGCSTKLCVDRIICDKLKDACDSKSKYIKNYMKEKCAATCGFCRAPASPMKKCEEQNPQYGCCWNGNPATGPGSQGCPSCVDTSRHVCKLFQDKCNSKFFIEQTFMERHCPRTCGRCSNGCFDFNAKCGQWTLEGLCKRQIWAHFMKKHCSKSCGYCRGVAVKH